jgi:hypothetical protein
MDPIESMLRSINPVPDEPAGATWARQRLGVDVPEEFTAHTGRQDSRHGYRRRARALSTVRAMAIGVAAVMLIVAAGFLGVLGRGPVNPAPAGPTPSPSPTTLPTPDPTPSRGSTPAPPSAAAPPATDPTTGVACVFGNVSTHGQSGPMLRNMETHPGDFKVLGCASGWLALELTDGGYQRLVAQGAGQGSGAGDGNRSDIYFARFDGNNYVVNKTLFVPAWETLAADGGTPVATVVEMDRQVQQKLGVSPALRPALVGGPPASQAGTVQAPPNAAVDDPNTGAACSMDFVKTMDNPDAWVVQDINAHPKNYTVLHCAGGWLSFKLSDAGYRQWLEDFQATGHSRESSPYFYFAKFDTGAYEFRLGWTVPNWDPRPGIDSHPEARATTMEAEMEMAGIPGNLRRQLVGSPPE